MKKTTVEESEYLVLRPNPIPSFYFIFGLPEEQVNKTPVRFLPFVPLCGFKNTFIAEQGMG